MNDKTVIKRLPMTSLQLTYSRKLSENKYRNYVLSASDSMLAVTKQKNVIEEYLAKNEGISPENLVIEDPTVTQEVPTLNIVDANIGLSEDVVNSLGEKQSTLVYQYEVPVLIPNNLQRVLGLATSTINLLVVDQLNRVIAFAYKKLFAPKAVPEPEDSDWSIDSAYFGKDEEYARYLNTLRKFYNSIPKIKRLPEFKEEYESKMIPAQFLSLSFEEGFEDKAKAIMKADIEKLNSFGAIMAHLVSPSVMMLSSDSPIGARQAALFTILFVNLDKLVDKDGNQLKIEDLGLLSLTKEGELKRLPELMTDLSHVEIETVQINDSTWEEWERSEYGKKIN
jgi:hypothetical protein